MPPKFEFRLQPLLDRRKIVEEEKQGNFAACRRAVDECARELARLGDARRHSLKQLVETALKCPTADILLRHAHLRCVEVAIDDARHRHLEAEADLERARQELISASRERRLIGKLKEHRSGPSRPTKLAAKSASSTSPMRAATIVPCQRGWLRDEPKERLGDRAYEAQRTAGHAELRSYRIG